MSRPVHATAPVRRKSRQLLADLADLPLNFALDELPRADDDAGWHIDDHCRALPFEPPGEPQRGGPFETACLLLDRYAMVDSNLVRAVFYTDVPLAGRDMVLEGHFFGLRFPMGVRVGEVIDDDREINGRRVRVRGWSYRTLDQHLERGQLDWAVWKWVDTGAVEFRLHVVSQHAHVDNPIVALGLRVFGRWMQVRFARDVLRRMNRLVASACGVVPAHRPCVDVPRTVDATVEEGHPHSR